MRVDLSGILDQLRPANLAVPIRRHVNDAINNFHVSSEDVYDRESFRCVICAFIYRASLSAEQQLAVGTFPLEEWLPRSQYMLGKAYPPGGESTAYDIVSRGLDGGIHAVVRRLGDVIIRGQVEREARLHINEFLSQLGPDWELAAAREYVRQHADLLPADWRGQDPSFVPIPLSDLLMEHARKLDQLADVGRNL